MGFNLPPAGREGYWGPVTSLLDWCEPNYDVSYYVAEWWNSWSNLNFFFFSLLGMWSCWRTGAELRLYLNFLSFFIVGLGSFAFHATLLYYTQLSDELPMIYCTCFFVFSLVQMWPPERNGIILVLALLLYSVAVSVIYIYNRNPVFHEVSYAFLVSFCVFLPLRHMNKLAENNPGEKRQMMVLYAVSFASYFAGFALWNVENLNCTRIREWREQVGYPWRVVSELHAWWHLLTGYGTYGSCVLTQLLRMRVKGRDDVRLQWVLGMLPVLVVAADEQRKRKAA